MYFNSRSLEAAGSTLSETTELWCPQKCVRFSPPVRPVLRKGSDEVIHIKDCNEEYIIAVGLNVFKGVYFLHKRQQEHLLLKFTDSYCVVGHWWYQLSIQGLKIDSCFCRIHSLVVEV